MLEGFSLVVAHGPLTMVASLVAEHGLWGAGSIVAGHGLVSPQYVGTSGIGA